METFISGRDEDEATGAEGDGVDENSDVKRTEDGDVDANSDVRWVEEIGVDDKGDVAGIKDIVAVDKVVYAVDSSKLAAVGFTDKTITFADDVDGFVDVEEGLADAEDDFTDFEVDKVHSPKPAWQPFPQKAEDEPQYPLLEQQFPNTEFLQVRVFLDC